MLKSLYKGNVGGLFASAFSGELSWQYFVRTLRLFLAALLATCALSPPVALAQNFAATGGVAGIGPIVSTSAESCHVLKSSAGYLFGVGGYGGQSEWVMVFNATSAPSDGAVTPVEFGYLGSSGAWGMSFQYPIYLSTGITVCYSSTGPFTKTAISTNNAFSAQVQ